MISVENFSQEISARLLLNWKRENYKSSFKKTSTQAFLWAILDDTPTNKTAHSKPSKVAEITQENFL